MPQAVGGIQAEDHNIFRVYKAILSEARQVLLAILTWGCPKNAVQTFEDYLIQDVGLNTSTYNKWFNKDQRENLRSNPSGNNLDITLIFKVIQASCPSLAPVGDDKWKTEDDTRLEYLLTWIKNSRNNVVHGETSITKLEMVQCIEKLREVLVKTLRAGSVLYAIDSKELNEKVNQLHNNLFAIRDQPLTPIDFSDYRNHLLYDSLKDFLCIDGKKELWQTYKTNVYMNPLSFLDDKECYFQVRTVFIDLLIYNLSSKKRLDSISYKDLLEYCLEIQDDNDYESSNANSEDGPIQKPYIVFLEGRAGCGKTTLLRFILSEWISEGRNMKGLGVYDLVLHLECRNPHVDSLLKLLTSLMPRTVSKIDKNDLIQIFLSLKLLVLIDGLDELNKSSSQVLREFLGLKNTCDISFICTMRTEKVKEMNKLVSGKARVIHLKIQGILEEKMEDFLRVFYDQFKQKDMSHEHFGTLLQFIHEAPAYMQDYFRLPINMVLLTFLWVTEHLRLNQITSQTTLYIEIYKLLMEKLYERLKHNQETQHLSLTTVKNKVVSFLNILYEEALKALGCDELYLGVGTIETLQGECFKLGLPSEEIFSVFLVTGLNIDGARYIDHLSFPHKGVHDFYAANHIMSLVGKFPLPKSNRLFSHLDVLLCQMNIPEYQTRQIISWVTELLGKPRSIHSVLQEVHEIYPDSFKISKYQNVLYHLLGLLGNSDTNVLQFLAEEIVNLLARSIGKSLEHWVDVLKEANYHAKVAEEISKYLPKCNWTVTDGQLEAVASFLRYFSPKLLNIDIMGDPAKLSQIYNLLEAASTSNCVVHLYLHHHWRYPQSGLSNCYLLKLRNNLSKEHFPVPSNDNINIKENSPVSSVSSLTDLDNSSGLSNISLARKKSCHISSQRSLVTEVVMGRLNEDGLLRLPGSMQELHLALVDDNDALDLFAALPIVAPTLINLRSIWLHVVVGILPELLPRLPRLQYRPRLYLSGVTDENIAWASRVAQTLMPTNSKFASINLARSEVSERGVRHLATRLGQLNVQVYSGKSGGLCVASAHITSSHLTQLQEHVQRSIGCPFFRMDNEEIWNDESVYERVVEYDNLFSTESLREVVTMSPVRSSSHNDDSREELYEDYHNCTQPIGLLTDEQDIYESIYSEPLSNTQINNSRRQALETLYVNGTQSQKKINDSLVIRSEKQLKINVDANSDWICGNDFKKKSTASFVLSGSNAAGYVNALVSMLRTPPPLPPLLPPRPPPSQPPLLPDRRPRPPLPQQYKYTRPPPPQQQKHTRPPPPPPQQQQQQQPQQHTRPPHPFPKAKLHTLH